MVAPPVVIGAGIVAGIGAIWAATRLSINPKQPVMTRHGSPARILTAKRDSPDGCSIVAAVHCGQLGELVNIYTRKGVFGGTLWRADEISMGTLEFQAVRDLSNLFNTPKPVLPPLSSQVVDAAAVAPLDFSRSLKTRQGNRVEVLAEDRVDPQGGRIVALVHLQWFHLDAPDIPPTQVGSDQVGSDQVGTDQVIGDFIPTDEQVVNVYDRSGKFVGSVIAETDLARGRQFLNSVDFESRRDMSDLRYG